MDLETATAWASARKLATLITIRDDGRPQSSDVVYAVNNGNYLISLTDNRAKTKNIRRDPRVVLHISEPASWSYLSLDGTVELTSVTAAPDDETSDALVSYFEAVNGSPHPDWAEYRQAHEIGNLSKITSLGRAIEICAGLDIDYTSTATEWAGVKVTSATPVAPSNNGGTKPTSATSDAPSDLEQFFSPAVARALNEAFAKADSNSDNVQELIDAAISRAIEPEIEVVTKYIYQPVKGEAVKLEGLTHPMFERLLIAVNEGVHVMLVGPAASGKSFACEQVAKALNLDFYFQGIALEGFDLTGYVGADGTYLPPAFVKAFLHGGLYLGDEMDSWQPAASLAINAPLAGQSIYLPTGEAFPAHEDFRFVAACNTWGQGASHAHNAREKMDDSSLSRLAYKLDWFTSPELEMSTAGDNEDHVEWVREVQAARAASEAMGLSVKADMRMIKVGYDLMSKMPIDWVREGTYLAGLDSDQASTLARNVRLALAS
jgi:PPOX class probable F420-dependent enzyme